MWLCCSVWWWVKMEIPLPWSLFSSLSIWESGIASHRRISLLILTEKRRRSRSRTERGGGLSLSPTLGDRRWWYAHKVMKKKKDWYNFWVRVNKRFLALVRSVGGWGGDLYIYLFLWSRVCVRQRRDYVLCIITYTQVFFFFTSSSSYLHANSPALFPDRERERDLCLCSTRSSSGAVASVTSDMLMGPITIAPPLLFSALRVICFSYIGYIYI